jgi:hypothetical protein
LSVTLRRSTNTLNIQEKVSQQIRQRQTDILSETDTQYSSKKQTAKTVRQTDRKTARTDTNKVKTERQIETDKSDRDKYFQRKLILLQV